MRRPSRNAIAALSVSAAAFAALVGHEGYTDRAVIPVKGDVPTVGFGSTVREDGSRVEMGDTITPQKAIARSLWHIQKDERGIKSCITAPLSQVEYDLMVDFSYQYGVPKLCKSSMAREANAGNYAQSCAAYLEYKKVAGYDCSTPGNRRCAGVWTRSQERYQACMAAQ
jgi:lysozyme